jgi:dUTP pyrophosphatase
MHNIQKLYTLCAITIVALAVQPYPRTATMGIIPIVYMFGLVIIGFLYKDNTLRLYSLHTDTRIPQKATSHSAGWDMSSSEHIHVLPHSRVLVATDVYIHTIPPSCYLRIAPRSGWAVKGLDVAAGVVDADYRGEIKVLLVNTTDNEIDVPKHTRIAQLITEKYADGPLEWNGVGAKEEALVMRGLGGFGSSGM